MSEKIKEEKYGQIIGQLKQLRLSELQRYKETKGELSQQTEEFIKIILAHWVGSLAAIKREIRPSELNKELAKLNEPKDNLIVMEKLFDLAWFMCAKLKHSEKRHEFARSKTWRMIEWHYYEELEWKLCKTRDLIRKTLVTEFQVPNSFALTIDLPFHLEMVWFGPPAENIAGWVLKDGGTSNSESSSSKNGEIIDNGGNKKPKKKQKFK
ncbi:hypothetical protein niasHT_034204 [Heterodera trifolii]|uniref:Uncharacterized protein n=1 Tax=Heterodera trifolii TaxID=157864 RepID=A0ABD2J5E6_9BILA